MAGESDAPLEGAALVKEVCRRIRLAKARWDAHENRACRRERERALEVYGQLTKAQKEEVPQPLRVWLRYRSEKYFGPGTESGQTAKGVRRGNAPSKKQSKRRRGQG